MNETPRIASRALFNTCALAASIACACQAMAQTAASLPEVRIQAGAAAPATERAAIGGVSDAPLAETPMSVSVVRMSQARELGDGTLSSIMRTQPSVGDFYNTVGYVESLQVRGFLLDNATNYRRDGIQVSNWAPIALENKESIEILKGVSGMQSGVSAPGGLVNYVLKRPTAEPLRELFLGLSERGTTKVHADVGGRLGEGQRIGYRINVANEERRPEVRTATGSRQFASAFLDLRLPGAAVLEAEFEQSNQRQFSVPGFSLLDRNGDGVADTLPRPVDPRINLGAQPWAMPFDSRAGTGSVRFQQALNDQWLYGVRYGAQRIRTNDRLAFPDGCSSGPNYLYPGFCGNQDFDVYDYRSNNEIRSTRSLEAFVRGELVTGGVRHELGGGVKTVRYTERYEPMQAYNWVGISNVISPVALPADPTMASPNTQRDSRNREFWLTDTMRAGAFSLWLGVRHTRLERASERTDGSEAVSYEQSFTTPWAALGWQPWAGGFTYVSAGRGVETEFVPNRPSSFSNHGVALPALRSRQMEAGFKQVLSGAGMASIALFEVDKPYSDDVAQQDGRVLRVANGREARHRGVELAWSGRPVPRLWLQAQATLIDARIVRSVDPELVGRRATNVAPVGASATAAWNVPGIDGLTWTNRAFYSGRKAVTRDNTIELPAYWQLDTALSFQQRVAGRAVTWRAGIDNLLDRRYWKDAPTQYWGGTYLFPAPPRTLRTSVQIAF